MDQNHFNLHAPFVAGPLRQYLPDSVDGSTNTIGSGVNQLSLVDVGNEDLLEAQDNHISGYVDRQQVPVQAVALSTCDWLRGCCNCLGVGVTILAVGAGVFVLTCGLPLVYSKITNTNFDDVIVGMVEIAFALPFVLAGILLLGVCITDIANCIKVFAKDAYERRTLEKFV